MSGFYRPINFSGPGGPGSNDDTADGAHQLLENVSDAVMPSQAPDKAAAKLFLDAAAGGTSALDHTPLSGDFPHVHLEGSFADAFHGAAEMASQMGDPFGLLQALFSFLQAVLSTDWSQAMTSIANDQFAAAAEAAIEESTKKLLGK